MTRKLIAGVAVLIAAAIPGCSEAHSRVYGKVQYQGKPLAGATVTFFGANNKTYTADTGPDGTYDLPAVVRGPLRVSVQLQPHRPTARPVPPEGRVGAGRSTGDPVAAAKDNAAREAAPPPPPKSQAAGVQLPARYADPNSSGLSLDLTEPEKKYDIDLK
jgi:hypothetical protein